MLLMMASKSPTVNVVTIFILVIGLMLPAFSDTGKISAKSKFNSGAKNSEEKPSHLKKSWINVTPNDNVLMIKSLGDRVELECEAYGIPPPTIEWVHEGRKLFRIGFEDFPETPSTSIVRLKTRYLIDCLLPHDQGAYKCVATSGTKTGIASVGRIMIDGSNMTKWMTNCEEDEEKAPRIVLWPSIILQEDAYAKVRLPCIAIGNPEPKVYWINNNDEIIDEDTISSRYQVRDGLLVIEKMQWSDMGRYTCIAENSVGQDKTSTFLYPVKSEQRYNPL